MKKIFALFTILIFQFAGAQDERPSQKFTVSGNVIEKISGQPLEYATITIVNPARPKAIAGGITDSKGQFSVEVAAGVYDIKIEFISFKPSEIKQRSITSNTNLGTVALSEDITQLGEVTVRADRTTVEIKLDKKVYNVGADLLVKGGTVSDVLDNIPSVSVDADGVVSLRGNENVRILIDGRPSNAININEALRQIPADAIDKVEVVTNPSARYESEGGGGLLNIILKKGKGGGLHGTFIATAGDPRNYSLSGAINFKTDVFNVFTTTGYSNRLNLGRTVNNNEYLNPDNSTRKYIDEYRRNSRNSEGYNSNFGAEWYLNKSTTWTNSINLRRNGGGNLETVQYDNYDAAHNFLFTDYRINDQVNHTINGEYDTNLIHNFGKEGHKLTIDGAFSTSDDDDNSVINTGDERTSNLQRQGRNTISADYVLPFGKGSQFEAGFRGDYNKLVTDYKVDTLSADFATYVPDHRYTNTLQYKEHITAFYSQYGRKIQKLSVLLGLRWENSDIVINQLATLDFNNKKYNNLFPSAFLTYEISPENSVSMSYSRRIQRPRGRQINPFSNYSSNINIFRGNPNLDPSLTDAIDLGYLRRWDKLTFNTSLYANRAHDSFQFIRSESGDFVGTTPVILTTPVNIATETRYGFEFTLNYSPFKWWKLNGNFNYFQIETDGSYTYANSQGAMVIENLDNTASSWFSRLTSKVTLPYKIDWQTNLNYNGPQDNAQGSSKGSGSANLAFSKDVLKDNGTISFNVQDLFNSRKRIFDTTLDGVSNTHSEMQWRQRQVTLSFTYRFNKLKNDRDKQQKRGNENGGSDDDFGQ